MLLAIGRLTEDQWERGLATFNLPKLICVVNNIQEIRFAVLDKSCKMQRAQPCCCSKLASKHPAELSCCSKLASKHSAQLTFCLKLATLLKKLKLVQNIVCNCPVD